MVQILENNDTDIFSALLGGANQIMKHRAGKEAVRKENEALKKLGIEAEGIRDPKLRQALLENAGKLQEIQANSKVEKERLKNILGEDTEIFGDEQNSQGNQPPSLSTPPSDLASQGENPEDLFTKQPATQKKGLQGLSEEKLVALTGAKGYAEAAKAELRRREADKKEDREDRRERNRLVADSYKENSEWINKAIDSYESGKQKEAILERMGQIEEKGELTPTGVMAALETLGLDATWLKNPSNDEYVKLGLDLLGGGTLQSDYGSRVLASEFKVSQQRIPSLNQTPEGRKQIIENMKFTQLPNQLKHERLQYYLDKSEREGKPLPHNLRSVILRDIKPELDEAYDKFKQRNGRYKVKEGTQPDDNAIEKYWYITDGDVDKARKMMTEDGYDV